MKNKPNDTLVCASSSGSCENTMLFNSIGTQRAADDLEQRFTRRTELVYMELPDGHLPETKAKDLRVGYTARCVRAERRVSNLVQNDEQF
jgi:hypothetical protein